MKRFPVFLLLIGLVVSLLCNFHQCRSSGGSSDYFRDTTKMVIPVYDTIPIPKDSLVLRYETHYLPIHDKTKGAIDESALKTDTIIIRDSVAVDIPITQTKYETPEYRAYVSGFRASLDSVITFNTTNTIHIRSPTPKPKRFSIGIQGGYGFTPSGFQPYIGFGISYSIWSF